MRERRVSGLKVRRMAVNNVNMVVAHGDCDICSVQLLKDAMAEVIKEGHKKLIVDVKNLRYLDSSGLAAILWARHKIEEGDGRLVTIGLNGNLGSAVNPLGDLLSTAASVREALGILSEGRLKRK
ncbi:MAG: STAS domain-containing protein [Actinobacteria bacterium]|nr:STAS domain-containing protein [Actinomycetota bacterium]